MKEISALSGSLPGVRAHVLKKVQGLGKNSCLTTHVIVKWYGHWKNHFEMVLLKKFMNCLWDDLSTSIFMFGYIVRKRNGRNKSDESI